MNILEEVRCSHIDPVMPDLSAARAETSYRRFGGRGD